MDETWGNSRKGREVKLKRGRLFNLQVMPRIEKGGNNIEEGMSNQNPEVQRANTEAVKEGVPLNVMVGRMEQTEEEMQGENHSDVLSKEENKEEEEDSNNNGHNLREDVEEERGTICPLTELVSEIGCSVPVRIDEDMKIEGAQSEMCSDMEEVVDRMQNLTPDQKVESNEMLAKYEDIVDNDEGGVCGSLTFNGKDTSSSKERGWHCRKEKWREKLSPVSN